MGMFRAILLLSAAGSLAVCSVGLAQAAAKKPDTERLIAKSLAKYAGAPVLLVDVTYERRGGRNIACGLYRRAADAKSGIARHFGWIDNKLVMKFGPDWNQATLCLRRYYGMAPS